MRRPNFFIVGAPKCGTTAMYTYLEKHPEVFMSRVKEPHFFSTDLYPPHFIREEKKYLELFSGAQDQKRVGEASATYLYSKVAAAKIKEFSPSARILIMLRNPVDVMYSLHSQRLYNATEDIKDFEKALDAAADRRRNLQSGRGAFHLYQDVVDYAPQIIKYQNIFDSDMVHIAVFDDLKRSPSKVYRETLHFLNVNEEFRPIFKVVNSNKNVRSILAQRFIRFPPPAINNFFEILPYRLGKHLKNLILRLNAPSRKRSPMDPNLRARLQKDFKPKVELLSELLDRDLTHWCKSEQ